LSAAGVTLAIYGAVNTALYGSRFPSAGGEDWYAARSGLGVASGAFAGIPLGRGHDVIAYLTGAGAMSNDAAWPAIINGLSLLALAVAAWLTRRGGVPPQSRSDCRGSPSPRSYGPRR